ncbi:MAG TPA: site-specific integrase [Planctomycetota bacterium]|nr:site-specific integrase [Planctomycetota bacterium]
MDERAGAPENRSLTPGKLTVPTRRQASAQRGAMIESGRTVPHIGRDAVARAAGAAARTARDGGTRGRGNAQRDELLMITIFDGALRVSEALRLRPCDIVEEEGHPRLRILGKGKKHAVVSVSASLASRLKAYAYDAQIAPEGRFFPFTRARAHQIIARAYKAAGVTKPGGVGTCHVLRHSGAIERLRETGNPRAVQEQLRHASANMTLRYLKTISAEEALRIQDQVDFRW